MFADRNPRPTPFQWLLLAASPRRGIAGTRGRRPDPVRAPAALRATHRLRPPANGGKREAAARGERTRWAEPEPTRRIRTSATLGRAHLALGIVQCVVRLFSHFRALVNACRRNRRAEPVLTRRARGGGARFALSASTRGGWRFHPLRKRGSLQRSLEPSLPSVLRGVAATSFSLSFSSHSFSLSLSISLARCVVYLWRCVRSAISGFATASQRRTNALFLQWEKEKKRAGHRFLRCTQIAPRPSHLVRRQRERVYRYVLIQ